MLYFVSDIKNNKIFKQDIFFLFLILLSVLVFYIANPNENLESRSLNEAFPYTLSILSVVFFARKLEKKTLQYLFYFIIFEIVIGVIEYIIGVPYLVQPENLGETEFGQVDLMYFNRVYGLSPNVSVFALKILCSLIFLFLLNIKKKFYVYLILILLGLFVSFNRTSIICGVLFIGLYLMFVYSRVNLLRKIGFFSLSVIIGMIIFYNLDLIEYQFFRGKDDVDLSGRDFIFTYFLDFIESNFLLGNAFHKVWLEIGGVLYHAHNSYLQTFANMGIIFSSLFILYFCTFINKRNIIYLIPILVYSTFQYGILWGISFLDIVFFYLLFNLNNLTNE